MSLVLGLDIGTTSTVGILIRLPGEVAGLASRPVTLSSPHGGWAEEDPEQWWQNVCAITRELLSQPGVTARDIKAVGITGMLPAVVLLDSRDRLIRPSIQQSDGRCGAEVEALRREVDEEAFVKRAGNGVNQQLVAAKLRWIERHEPENFARIATVFGSYDFINRRLTGVRAAEQNWALEAGFVDLGTGQIADDLVALAHIPVSAVPPKTLSHAILGAVTPEAAEATGLAVGTPVIGGGADHIASALGAGIVEPGDVLLKFGGSVDVLVATDRAVPDPRLYLDYHLVPGLYMPNGCMATGGSALNWFAAQFAGGAKAEAEARGISVHQRLDELADAVPAGADGVLILPYFLGEKTPIHDADIRGMVSGLSLSHGLGHLWRALLEAYGYAILHHIEVMRDMGLAPRRYLASDGGAASRVWMQIVADILQAPVERLTRHPGSCLGVAWAAAMGIGLADDWLGVTRFAGRGETIRPDPAKAHVYQAGYNSYRDLYRRVDGDR
jgi:xylulokinase